MTDTLPTSHAKADMPATGTTASPMHGFLHRLGVYGFADMEPVILAALMTADLLPVGRAGNRWSKEVRNPS